MKNKESVAWLSLLVLLGINLMNFYDRQVLGAVSEPLRKDWDLSDKQLGALGTAFTLLYAFVGVPLGRLADQRRRTWLLAGGALLWSALTAISGLAWSFWSLFVFRLGVGVGEATCAPAANSMIGDLFPAERRGTALAIFMVGLPVGLALSFWISGDIAQSLGWRGALFVAGLPGLFLGLLMFWVPEPLRGTHEKRNIGSARRPGSPLLAVLRIPTVWWIIVSGALHNFNAYALGAFLSPFLQRFHGLTVREAGRLNAVVYGCGGLGVLLGGWACDKIVRRRISGRMEVATAALVVFVPSLLLALSRPPGDWLGFAICFLPGCMFSYVYYAGVYATLQDIVEPALRGTSMAIYFLVMYLFASLGPLLTGSISDFFASRAAAIEGSTADSARAIGLHDAMYVVPFLGALLVVVLFAGSRTVTKDYLKLQKWMEATAGTPTPNHHG
jgi:predicted MFS family arabinose efflux permease